MPKEIVGEKGDVKRTMEDRGEKQNGEKGSMAKQSASEKNGEKCSAAKQGVSEKNVVERSEANPQKQRKSKKCLELFLTFFKIGAFTFGGGYAMVSLIQQETAERKKWVSQEDILDMLAIAESTPGPIAINSATFVGFKRAGFWGALSATFGGAGSS